ncbi:MAG: ABC transporter ATP-binding protein [Pseudomonadota bacterium]
MSSERDVAIRVRDITKHFLMYERPEDRLKQMIVPRLERLAGRQPRRYFRDFAALNGVSFEVGRGETVGIIGRNGCGKSTLLQIVCGTLQPSSGSVEVNGRIAALLELGAGFNPEFTGRENVFLNAAILGLSRAETERRYDDIARFADIGIFINQPVKTYSSGMYVRLAFAVAINVDPDILVVDEALAVGDEAFQRKCYARIEDIKDKGATILFVSHGAQTIVQLCDWAMLIDRGEKILEGKPKTVVNQYQRFVNQSGEAADATRAAIVAMDGWAAPADIAAQTNGTEAASAAQQGSGPADEGSTEGATNVAPEDPAWFDPSLIPESRVEYEQLGAEISDVRVTTLDGRKVNVLEHGRRYEYRYRTTFRMPVDRVAFGMMLKTTEGYSIGGASNLMQPERLLNKVTSGTIVDACFTFSCQLLPGVYFVNAGTSGFVAGRGERIFTHRLIDAYAIRVMSTSHIPLANGLVSFDQRLELDVACADSVFE